MELQYETLSVELISGILDCSYHTLVRWKCTFQWIMNMHFNVKWYSCIFVLLFVWLLLFYFVLNLGKGLRTSFFVMHCFVRAHCLWKCQLFIALYTINLCWICIFFINKTTAYFKTSICAHMCTYIYTNKTSIHE